MELPPAKKRRHRFQKVTERVTNLQHELTLHAKTTGAIEEASQLSFREELALQAELTTLDSFQLLFRRLQPLVTTTPHLLHYLKKVVTCLQTEFQEAHQDQEDPIVLRQRLVPVLKLVTALARELGKEFYPHFAAVLPLLVDVIDTKDPELSTQVFKTLTMLFSYLRVQLLADMDAVHKCYFPLLGHSRDFVRDFAAQTLAVLLRRLESPKAMKKYLRVYLTALVKGSGRSHQVLRDGSAKLFFALVKNVGHGFHSRMREVLLFLLGSFRPISSEKEETLEQLEQQESIYEIVYQTCGLMMKHTDAEHSGEMLDCLVLVVNKVVKLRHAEDEMPTEAQDLYLSRVLRVLLGFLISRRGQLITETNDAYEVRVPSIHKICTALVNPANKVFTSQSTVLRDVLMAMFEAVWRLYPAADDAMSAQMKTFFAVAGENDRQRYWCHKLLAFVHQALHHSHVNVGFVVGFLLPNALEYALKTLLHIDVVAFSELLCHLGDYVTKFASEISDGQSEHLVRSKTSSRSWLLLLESVDTNAEDTLFDAGRKLFEHSKNTTNRDSVAAIWKFCKALGCLQLNDAGMISFTTPLIAKLDQRLTIHDATVSATELACLRAELWLLQQAAKHHQSNCADSETMKENVEQALLGNKVSYKTLSTLLVLIDMDGGVEQHVVLTVELLPQATNSLFAALRSPAHELRLVALQLLARFKRLNFLDSDSGSLSGPCILPDVCVSLELACEDIAVATEREVVRLLTRVKIYCQSSQTPVLYKEMALNHLLGLYHVKFSTIWPHVADAVESALRLHFNECWPYVSSELLVASHRQDEEANEKQNKELSNKSAVTAEFERVCMLEQGRFSASTATDAITYHALMWKGLTKFADLVESKTKFMVPLFVTFLRDQYSVIYVNELDTKRLDEIDQSLAKLEESSGTCDSNTPEWRRPVEFQGLTTKEVRGKFVDQLKLFAAFQNMKGAYAQQLLHALFFDLLMKSDEMISKLALQCIYAFRSKAVVSYKLQLNRLADSSSFREELSSFNIKDGEGVVLREHRPELLPVLLRLLYSKCVSKKGRNNGDTVAARRAAVLAYLAALEASDLASFVELVVRAFGVTIERLESGTPEACVRVGAVQPAVAAANVQPSRILGFLNLLEDLIKQLSVKLAVFIPHIADVLLSILQISVLSSKDGGDTFTDCVTGEEKVVSTVGSKRKQGETSVNMDTMTTSASMKKQIRTLTYHRLAEMVDTFDSLVHLQPWVVAVLDVSHESITHLPNAVIGADKTSSLLELLVFDTSECVDTCVKPWYIA
uniref:U3 small nucleolar RNA-associated protein 20 N-terminal domain-containing protein n=1 Tax=Hyaloperonospora arabidopsidis (strain Emoy2) TaxID=559515 RepID=M4BA80_HYAAE